MVFNGMLLVVYNLEHSLRNQWKVYRQIGREKKTSEKYQSSINFSWLRSEFNSF